MFANAISLSDVLGFVWSQFGKAFLFIVMTAVSCWILSQSIKLTGMKIKKKKITMKNVFQDGGISSTHSAVVTGGAIAALLKLISNSNYTNIQIVAGVLFGCIFICFFTIIRDAFGHRRSTQINGLILKYHLLESENKSDQNIFNGFIEPTKPISKYVETSTGHTKNQVIFGIIIGVIVGSIRFTNVFVFLVELIILFVFIIFSKK